MTPCQTPCKAGVPFGEEQGTCSAFNSRAVGHRLSPERHNPERHPQENRFGTQWGESKRLGMLPVTIEKLVVSNKQEILRS